MQIKIKTLSPLHIGNGESYNKLSLIQDRRKRPIKLYHIPFEALKEEFDQNQMQRFSEWVVKEQFPDLSKFLRYELNDQNFKLSNTLQRKADYSADLLFEENPGKKRFLKDIECFIKQNNKIYIPGSEIKGAIRTAVLYHLLKEDSVLYDDLKQKIETFGQRHERDIEKVGNKRLERWMREEKRIKSKKLVPEMSKIEDDIQKKVFRCGRNNDAKYDLLKNLFVSDTEAKSPLECLFISNLTTTNISRSFDVFQELCREGTEFTCQGFDLQNKELILSTLGFSKEQRWVIENVSHLFKCCYEFYNRLLDEEIGYFRKNSKYPEIIRRLEEIKKQNEENSPVIRIGKGEGYFSLTMGLLIDDRDNSLYNNVLIHATKNTSYTGNFPKTRRIVNLGEDKFDTLGWVKLIKER